MITVARWSSGGYSQSGEDGIIATMLGRIGEGDRRCIEFGAHDSLTFAKAARLRRDAGWHALLTEPDPARLRILTTNASGFPSVRAWAQHPRTDEKTSGGTVAIPSTSTFS